MTVRTPLAVAGYWVNAKGPLSRAVEWVAIAMGESSLDDSIVSPVGAIGLYQIMPFNAAPNGFTVSELYSPTVNARVAVLMSGGGTNCAAWDSCYRDIGATGRYRFLGYPEAGSLAYGHLAEAQAALSGHGLPPPSNPGDPGIDGTLAATVVKWQTAGTKAIPAISSQVLATTAVVGASYRKGWRP